MDMNLAASRQTARVIAFTLLAAPLAMLSCNPLGESSSGPTTVSGQVVSQDGGQAVLRPPQVQLWQRAQATGGGNVLSGGAAYSPLGDPRPVDGQGLFSFGFEAEAGHEYALRAEEGGLGYYTEWASAPALHSGQKNEGLRVPVAAPAWVRLDLVDEVPISRTWFTIWGWGGGGLALTLPRDTSVVVRYTAGRPETVLWEITDERGTTTRYSKPITLLPLDTQRVRIPF